MAVVSISNLAEAGNNHRLDAEFYQPEYFIDFSKGDWKPLRGFLDICQYGISQAMTEEPIGHPIFRMDDIKDCFLLDDEVKYIEISDRVFQQFKLQTDDILFNRVNAEEFVGRTGIFKLQGEYVFASYLIRLRVKPRAGLLADYLNIFLNTKYGKRQIRRFSRRAVNQANVNAEELQDFRIAMLPLSIQNEISLLSTYVWKQVELSKSLYRNAENLLLQELGVKDFQPKYELSYTASLFKAFGAHRVDAEYFQPAYENLMKVVAEKCSLVSLGRAFNFNRGIFVPTDYYTDEKTNRPYIRIKELSGRIGIEESKVVFINDGYPQDNNNPLKENDLVVAIIGDTIGKTNRISMELAGGFCSNNMGRLRIKSDWATRILPEFAELAFQSFVIQRQIERGKAQTGQPKISDFEIRAIKVPMPAIETQKEIVSLIQQSHGARRKAKELLEEAKKKVENLIEGRA
jgi:restriction endonuclease S subunit